jgi:ATP-binding cassette, subfamily B, bacterial PglK
MPPPQSLIILLRRLWFHINLRRRRQFALLLVLTALCSFAEIVSLSSVIPFIGIITQPDKIFDSPLMANPIYFFGLEKSTDLVIPITIAFLVASLLAGGLRIFMMWFGVRLGNVIGADLSSEVFRRTLYQPYSVHVNRSSSEVISGMTQKIGATTGVILAVVSIITSGIMFAAIMTTLFFIDYLVASISVIIFGSSYLFIAWLTRNRVKINGQLNAQEDVKLIKMIQEGLGGIRDILLGGVQEVYCNAYYKSAKQIQVRVSENIFMVSSPRYVMETLGMVLVSLLVLIMNYRSANSYLTLPVLGVLALGAQRSLPLMHLLYGSWTSILANKAALVDSLTLLDQPLQKQVKLSDTVPLSPWKTISFDNVSFHYGSHGPWVIDGFDLTISKGSRIGIIGSTGSGKSTTVDLLMCLLVPRRGHILVDGNVIIPDHLRSWQHSLAHVPQSIFLSDTTIAENIAFGIEQDQIDLELVRKASQQARIAEFIESRPEGYSTVVGERGVRLSGGQRQRIGIARALYKQASVLIFDEATSSLDNETEESVMEAIEGLSKDLTLIIIAHRLTTLKNCSQIVELGNGVVKRIGTYQDIVNQSAVAPQKNKDNQIHGN